MAIGRTFQQAFAKAMRSRELDVPPGSTSTATLLARAGAPAPGPLRRAARGVPPRRDARGGARAHADRPVVPARAARAGADPRRRRSRGERTFRSVDTCAAEFAAETPYYYSGWERRRGARTRSRAATQPSVVILGSGPNRIGQGIEFDYCCVHAAMTVREQGRDAVMVNCNPETVSTDYDTSDRLYFEPLTLEDVLAVVEVEKPEGVIVQFGGQTPLKLAAGLRAGRGAAARHERRGDRPGRGPRPLRRAARRGSATGRRPTRPPRRSTRRWTRRADGRLPAARAAVLRARRPGDGDRLLRRGAARLPRARSARRRRRARDLPRPLPRGRDRGRRRRPVRRRGRVDRRDHAARRGGRHPLRATRPACCRRTRSATRCSRRSASRPRRSRWASASSGCSTSSSRCRGGELYVIEANPRASRTVPFVSKATGVPLAKMACRVMLGEQLADLDLPADADGGDHVAVKEAVLPFDRFPAPTRCSAPRCARPARSWASRATSRPPSPRRRPRPARALPAVGHGVHHGDRPRQAGGRWASRRSCTTSASGSSPRAARRRRSAHGRARASTLNKIGEGSPHVVDWIERGDVDLVINTPVGTGARADGYEIRRAAVARGIPCITTLSGGMAAARAIAAGAPRRRAGPLAAGAARARPRRGRPRSRAEALSRGRLATLAPFGRRRAWSRPRDVGAYRLLAVADRRARAAARAVLHAGRGRAVGRGRRRAALPAARVLVPARGRRPARVPARGRRAGHAPAGRARAGDGLWLLGPLGIGFAARRRAQAAARGRRHRHRAARRLAGRARRRRPRAARLPRRAPTPRRPRCSRTRASPPTTARVGHHGLVTELLGRGARRRPGRRRLRLRPAADARGRARAVRRARRARPARARVGHGLRLRRLLRLRRADARRATCACASTARCSTRGRSSRRSA